MFQSFELICVGLATVVDAVLLLALFERRNRVRVAVPVALLIAGASMLHGGAFIRLLLFDFVGVWARQMQWTALLITTVGILLIPAAMTHCTWRLLRTGLAADPQPSRRYLAAYVPMLVLLPLALPLSADPRQAYIDVTGPVVAPFAVWTTAAHFALACGLFWRRRQWAEFRTPQFFSRLALLLGVAGAVQAFVLFYAVRAWPVYRFQFELVVLLTYVVPVALFGYFVVRHNFMQLMLERTIVYGAVLVGFMLFHHVAVLGLQTKLEDRFQIDFGILEAMLIVGLIVAYQPLRERVAESLRYLLGVRVDRQRKQLRSIAWQMSSLVGHESQELASWFCRTVADVVGAPYAAMWLFDGTGGIKWSCGEQRPYDDAQAATLYRLLKEADEPFVTSRRWLPAASSQLCDSDAGLAVRLDQPNAGGLVVFGRRAGSREYSQEEANALVLLVEQLGIMLHNSSLQAERLLAERRALQNEKLSTLGLLAGSIAHEIKNPLSSIKTLTTVMAEDLGPASPHAEDLRMILGEVDRLAVTISQLLNFVKPAPAKECACSVRAVLESTLGVMRHWARESGVNVTTTLDEGPISAAVDETALREVVFNLLKNAVEAAGRDGSVAVRCRTAPSTEGLPKVVLEIEDDGPGMPAEVQDRLFEPFVTTKATGTGLGLYLVGRQIRSMSGEVLCRSRPQDGTLFTITLPAAPILVATP